MLENTQNKSAFQDSEKTVFHQEHQKPFYKKWNIIFFFVFLCIGSWMFILYIRPYTARLVVDGWGGMPQIEAGKNLEQIRVPI